MFSKANDKTLESFIGVNTKFKGEIKTKGTLRVDGSVEGNIEADWVILGEKANLKGNANARGIVVGGSVTGNLAAREIVEIQQKGQITGDIVTAKLTVVEGGIIEGRTTMPREESKIVELAKEKIKESHEL